MVPCLTCCLVVVVFEVEHITAMFNFHPECHSSSFAMTLIPLPLKCAVLFLPWLGFLFSHLLPSCAAKPAGPVVWIQPN